MGNDNKTNDKSRRWFLSRFLPSEEKMNKPEMVKMLTADGKLVEVERSVIEAATVKQKVTNKEIFDWMDNPSKEKNNPS